MPLISAGHAFYSKTDMMAGGSGLVALDGPVQVWVECRDAPGGSMVFLSGLLLSIGKRHKQIRILVFL